MSIKFWGDGEPFIISASSSINEKFWSDGEPFLGQIIPVENSTQFIGSFHSTGFCKTAFVSLWNNRGHDSAPVETNVHSIGVYKPTQFSQAAFARLRYTSDAECFIALSDAPARDRVAFRPAKFSQAAFAYLRESAEQDTTVPIETNVHIKGVFSPARFNKAAFAYLRESAEQDITTWPETNVFNIGTFQQIKFNKAAFVYLQESAEQDITIWSETNVHTIGAFYSTKFSRAAFLGLTSETSDSEIQLETNRDFVGAFQPVRINPIAFGTLRQDVQDIVPPVVVSFSTDAAFVPRFQKSRFEIVRDNLHAPNEEHTQRPGVILYITKLGNNAGWLFQWPSTGDSYYRIVLNGQQIATVFDTTNGMQSYIYNGVGYSSYPPPLEVMPASAGQAATEINPPFLLIQWYGEPSASYYQVQEYVGGSWMTWMQTAETGSTVYTFQTALLLDGSTHDYQVLAYNDLGQPSATGLDFDATPLVTPPVWIDSAHTITYAAGNLTLT